ncbi:disulfide oxidoreductase [Gorillibacterium massiliense]|uniref:disulfide oxidoreductase n=1 Tax=Gorillibacterium massiliense TaxID=1280390 RepID=UPI0004B1913C|nr:disulfide oxidoreductase [Gorillibacterium massiliense]
MNGKRFLLQNGLTLAFTVAIVAAMGSLFLSEVLGYEPCKLCWFQRVFMYPLVFLLGIAASRKDYGIIRYAVPLAAIGSCISIFHYSLQKIPFLHEEVTICTSGVPCNEDYLNWWNVVTIPLLCLTAFALILTILLLLRRALKEE